MYETSIKKTTGEKNIDILLKLNLMNKFNEIYYFCLKSWKDFTLLLDCEKLKYSGDSFKVFPKHYIRRKKFALPITSLRLYIHCFYHQHVEIERREITCLTRKTFPSFNIHKHFKARAKHPVEWNLSNFEWMMKTAESPWHIATDIFLAYWITCQTELVSTLACRHLVLIGI